MKNRRKAELKGHIKALLRELEAAVERYVLYSETTAYRTAAVVMATLLTDPNALNTWVGQDARGDHSNIMEYLYAGTSTCRQYATAPNPLRSVSSSSSQIKRSSPIRLEIMTCCPFGIG